MFRVMLRTAAALSVFAIAAVTPAAADDRDTCLRGDGENAIAACTRLIERNRRDTTAYYNRGDLYLTKHDYDGAIADFNRAIRLDRSYAKAYSERGDAYRGKGNYDRAIADYDQAIRLNPNYAVTYEGRSRIRPQGRS
jgi:tetratricopeptide (TPR) repeat protein